MVAVNSSICIHTWSVSLVKYVEFREARDHLRLFLVTILCFWCWSSNFHRKWRIPWGLARRTKTIQPKKPTFCAPLHIFLTKKGQNRKKTQQTVKIRTSLSDYFDAQIVMHFEIVHVSPSDFSFPTISTTTSENLTCQTQMMLLTAQKKCL